MFSGHVWRKKRWILIIRADRIEKYNIVRLYPFVCSSCADGHFVTDKIEKNSVFPRTTLLVSYLKVDIVLWLFIGLFFEEQSPAMVINYISLSESHFFSWQTCSFRSNKLIFFPCKCVKILRDSSLIERRYLKIFVISNSTLKSPPS